MIDLYTWETSNGRKASIMLEECGLPYRVFPVNLSKGEQRDPAYKRINPYGKIPAIVDHDPPAAYGHQSFTVFESGSILLYLAEKAGKFLPASAAPKSICLQWLMFQVAGVGPFLGEVHFFKRHTNVDDPFARRRYSDEAVRLYRVMDARLRESDYLAGSEYTIADIATFPWIVRHEWQEIALSDYPNILRWYSAISARPAVRTGLRVPRLTR